ncbi:MAG TPA: tetraacyldisaccharide 4'-kinase, partial [Rhizomicrobium sp.]|nr:tetraacyldisaccharide 4'-kinase [Rhizomicrobium sp.]
WNRRGPLALLLAPLGSLYGMSVMKKARSASPFRAPVKVICVGNLTAGGSGKTPVAIAIAEHLAAQRKKVFFLTRGYGGWEQGPIIVSSHSVDDVGDEALLLARTAPTVVARDRAAGAKLAAANGADVIVMDDGHQNFSLAKDLSLVVVDGASGFGNRLMIPAGPLREPVAQGLARADAVIIVGDGAPDLQNFSGPVLRAKLEPEKMDLSGKPVFAFAGIGRPEKFVATLRALGAEIKATQFFPDHHPYTPAEIATLKSSAGGTMLITTEKDLVRLSPDMAKGITALKVRAAFGTPALLDRVLAAV